MSMYDQLNFLQEQINNRGPLGAAPAPHGARLEPAHQSLAWFPDNGLNQTQWDGIPGDIKRLILEGRRRTAASRIWLLSCCSISIASWASAIVATVAYPQMILARNSATMPVFQDSLIQVLGANWPLLMVISISLTSICGVLAVIHSYSAFRHRRLTISSELNSPVQNLPPPMIWEGYDLVVEMTNVTRRDVLGVEITRSTFSACQMIYWLTLIGTLAILFLSRVVSR